MMASISALIQRLKQGIYNLQDGISLWEQGEVLVPRGRSD
jgi:exonuclease VII small subunit